MIFQLPLSVQQAAFGPGWGNYAIKGIVEAELPSQVSMLPQTIGWLLLAGVFVLFVLVKLVKCLFRYWRNRYRRLALGKLSSLQKRIEAGDMVAARELPVLIKSTALQCYAREKIAPLANDDWSAFLSESYAGPKFETGDKNILRLCAYAPLTQLSGRLTTVHWQQFSLWITTHKVAT